MEHIFFAEIKKLMCLIVVFFGEKSLFLALVALLTLEPFLNPIPEQCSHFILPPKIENLWFFDVFRWDKMGTLAKNGLRRVFR